MHFISPKKFCISIVFNSLGTAVYPGEMKIKGYAKFEGRGGGGQIRCIMGNVELAYAAPSLLIYFLCK